MGEFSESVQEIEKWLKQRMFDPLELFVLRPSVVTENREELEYAALKSAVSYLSDLLSLPDSKALLLAGEYVEVYDTSRAGFWILGHQKAVAMFVRVGWSVKVIDARLGKYEFRLQKESHDETA